jgi:hypothetical protein
MQMRGGWDRLWPSLDVLVLVQDLAIFDGALLQLHHQAAPVVLDQALDAGGGGGVAGGELEQRRQGKAADDRGAAGVLQDPLQDVHHILLGHLNQKSTRGSASTGFILRFVREKMDDNEKIRVNPETFDLRSPDRHHRSTPPWAGRPATLTL